jgi:hypothetical protein
MTSGPDLYVISKDNDYFHGITNFTGAYHYEPRELALL